MKDETMTDQDKQSLIERAELNKAQEKEYITAEQVQAILNPLIEAMKKSAFTDDYKATTEEALGIILAKFYEWNGNKILKASANALEDANYHTESSIVSDLAQLGIAEIKNKYTDILNN